MQSEKKDFFAAMPPKASFIFGFVSGVATIAVLALVFFVFNGSGLSANSGATNTKPIAVNPTPNTAPKARPPAGNPQPITEKDHIRGDKNAPLTLIEYSDYECPFCKRFHPSLQKMMNDYGNDGKIKWVYRHFPLSFHDPLATAEAMTTECANELGGNDKFWEMSDLIFARTSSNGRGLNIDDLPKMAAEIGLPEDKMKECIDSGKYKKHIQADIAGGTSAGVTGTPGSFFIDEKGNAQLISGAVPYAQIQSVIEAAL